MTNKTMQTEFEATFTKINKQELRNNLHKAKAKLIRPEFLQRRENFFPIEDNKGWIRVRDEGNKVTMSYKRLENRERIDGQKEICLEVDDYEKAKEFLQVMNCEWKSFQETKRELWDLDGVEICIDEWPFLEPFVEIEGNSEQEVKQVCDKLGFDYSEAKFCAVGDLYEERYNIPLKIINNQTPKIIFDMKNPFEKNEK